MTGDTISIANCLISQYRCPEVFAEITVSARTSEDEGAFHFQNDVVCYGRCADGLVESMPTANMFDAWNLTRTKGTEGLLLFDPDEIVENLRRERYVSALYNRGLRTSLIRTGRHIYYRYRSVIPTSLRPYLKKIYLGDWEQRVFPRWPVDATVDLLLEHLLERALLIRNDKEIPFVWFWPHGYDACAIMTHDVETKVGYDFSGALMDMDETSGVRASFQIVPEERYTIEPGWLLDARARGFEVNIHDLNHDGHLFDERQEFLRRARRLDKYRLQYGAAGFRSGAMYRNQDWYCDLRFDYDMSVPNVAHLDPQHGGCCTVMPYFIGDVLELPLTTAQDYFMFYILNERSIDLWKKQIDLIRNRHGLISVLVHPDYVIAKSNRHLFQCLLDHLSYLRDNSNLWFALPGDVNRWWRKRSKMRLVPCGSGWKIEGEGSEHARIAYAHISDGNVAYRVERANVTSGGGEDIRISDERNLEARL